MPKWGTLWAPVCLLGCTGLGETNGNASGGGNSVTETSLECPAGTGSFCSVANVPTDIGPCSDDYGPPEENGCYNELNPPLPSILRPLSPTGTLVQGATGAELSNHHRRYPHHDVGGCGTTGSGACTQHMPHMRTTEDGNLALNAYWETTIPEIMVFRPENLGYEITTQRAGTNLPAPNSPAAAAGYEGSRVVAQIKRLALFNPYGSSLTPLLARPHASQSRYEPWFARVHQSTLCEDSSVAIASDRRNPYACSALYSTGQTRRVGHCYDITFLAAADEAYGRQRELISTDMTVFVAQPRSARRGNVNSSGLTTPAGLGGDHAGAGVYVYPRRPAASVMNAGVLELPPFEPFWMSARAAETAIYQAFEANPIPTSTSVFDAGDQIRALWDSVSLSPTVGCYEMSGTGEIVPRAVTSAPAYCQYYAGFHRTNHFYFDMDRDTDVEAPEPGGNMFMWNGQSGPQDIPFGQAVPGNIGCENGNCDFRPWVQYMQMIEPTTTSDGRLVFMNGLQYSVNRLGACRADGFDVWRPITMMPVDPAAEPYPLAHNGPFRDSRGREMLPGEQLHGAYPWVDRRGANIFFTASPNTRMTYRAAEAVGTAWATADNTNIPRPDWALLEPNFRNNGVGAMVMGAWTHGRAVVLDNQTNMTDFGGRYDTRFRLELYRDPISDTAASIWTVPKGAQFFNSTENMLNHFAAMAPAAPFDVVWTVATDQQMNSTVVFDEWMNPSAAVVAHMNAPIAMNGADEVTALDGFVPVHEGVVTDNVAGLSNQAAQGQPVQLPTHQFAAATQLQNASGYHDWRLRLLGGARVEPVNLGGAMGRGVYLDGNNDAIEVMSRTPVEGAGDQYLVSAWFDRRSPDLDAVVRTVFTFPDGSWIGLYPLGIQNPRDPHQQQVIRGPFPYSLVAYNGATREVKHLRLQTDASAHESDSPFRRERFTHLAVQTRNHEAGVRRLVFFVDGSRVGFLDFSSSRRGQPSQQVSVAHPGFRMHARAGSTERPFYLGDSGLEDSSRLEHRPFQGWVDELRIYGLTPNELNGEWFDENICNLALGTLVNVSAMDDGPLKDDLARRQGYLVQGFRTPFCEQMRLATHTTQTDFARQRLGEDGQAIQTACIGQVHLPAGAAAWCLRHPLLELPNLHGDVARPSSVESPFCLSCHHEGHEIAGLDLSALAPGITTCGQPPFLTLCPVPFWQDQRRQPLQPPAALSGFYVDEPGASMRPYRNFYQHLYGSTPEQPGNAHPTDVSLGQMSIGGRVSPWW